MCFHAVVPEGRRVTRVMSPRETLHPPSDQTLYCLYSVCTKESPRANGTDAKRATTLKANIFSWFSLKEKINLVLDISFCSLVYFSTFIMIQRSRFILLIYQRHVILDVYLSVSQWPRVRRVKTCMYSVCVVCAWGTVTDRHIQNLMDIAAWTTVLNSLHTVI